jgi:tetratricopeptide (TPR) repeat protein
MNSMAAMFYVLSLVLYVKGRMAGGKRAKVVWYSVMTLSGMLALGSKEIAATLPFFLLTYEWYFFQDLSYSWIKSRIPVLMAAVIFLIIISFIYLGYHPIQKISSLYTSDSLTMAQRTLSQFRIVFLYISLLLWPHPGRLILDYDFPPSNSLLDPVTSLLCMIAIIGFLGAAVLTAKKQRLISFCILWYFGNLVIESSIVNLELVYEHRNYLPSMFFICAAVFLSFRYFIPKWLAPVLLSVAAMTFAFWTYERNDVWRSPLLIWMDTIKKSPGKARPYNNLGVALADQGRYREAADQYRRALKIDPRYEHAYTNLGRSMASLGNMDAAMDNFKTALEINPHNYIAHNNLGIVLALQGKHAEAVEHFSRALAIQPDYVNAHNNLGASLKHQGLLSEAIKQFRTALNISPFFSPAHNNLGMALADQGRLDEAISHFKKALEIDPNYAAARRNLEETLRKK